MKISFQTLDPYYFFTSFAHMISRITHSDTETFKVLKHILAELIMLYPHQALWLSMAHARASPTKQAVRAKRCSEIFELAKRKSIALAASYGSSVDLGTLIRQYEYFAAVLMRFSYFPSPFLIYNLISFQNFQSQHENFLKNQSAPDSSLFGRLFRKWPNGAHRRREAGNDWIVVQKWKGRRLSTANNFAILRRSRPKTGNPFGDGFGGMPWINPFFGAVNQINLFKIHLT
jgi:hypothetical protein